MNIHLHIERLILEGLPVTSRDGELVEAALAKELTRLLSGKDALGISGGSFPELAVAPISFARNGKPAELGTSIAQSLHGGLSSGPSRAHSTHHSQGRSR